MKKKKVVDQATPVMPELDKASTSTKKATFSYAIIASMKSSPQWAAANGVQTATLAWGVDTDALDSNNKKIAALAKDLAAARAEDLILLRRWNASRRGVLNAVSTHSDGSKDTVLALSLSVGQKAPLPDATEVQELRAKASKKKGTAGVVWKRQLGASQYMVQSCTDPSDPATYAAPVGSSKASFELAGQTPGAMISFRVLALDPALPGGQTDYSPWIAVMVSNG
jgi:hypothetical protein